MPFEHLKDKTILITGGTGSFGRSFVRHLLGSEAKKIIVFSRDELKQFEMREEIKDKRLRFFLGDVRDLSRLQRAFAGVDMVVHAAALKQVPTLEYNPSEAIKTNILGSQNVIDAAIDNGVKKVVLISTDKAAQPVNLYGATKLCAEKIFIAGNSYSPGRTIFSAIRYGNVVASRGSVIETLLKNKNAKTVQITHEDMTRFLITPMQSFDLALYALEHMVGGEIFIPKLPSMKIVDLFDAFAPNAEKEVVGIRPGEKLHEFLLTPEEAPRAVELEDCYVVLSAFPYFSKEPYQKYFAMGKKIQQAGFYISSDKNERWLTKEDLLKLIHLA